MSIDKQLHKHIIDFLKKIEGASRELGWVNDSPAFKISFKLKPAMYNDNVLKYTVSIEEDLPHLLYGEYVSEENKLKNILK